MDHHSDQAYYVLGHKTDNIRDVYTLGRNLGEGRGSTTYLCTEIATGIDYACKSISKRKFTDKLGLEDARREIQIMHHLAGQKNIVTIKDAYEDSLYVYIVMEFCNGGGLFDRIVERGHYSERKAAELIKIIVGAVEACHSLGVMHRDLKPENFMFVNRDDDFSLKAIDFRFSAFFKPGQIFSDLVGCPYYVAPEVLRRHHGPEADVWSAGVILYILLSGVPPFWAETERGIFDCILKGCIDFESDPWPLISDSAKHLISKMLCLRPSDRLTAHEVLCHPWVCENGVAPNRALDPAVISRLNQFSAMNKLKKMALRISLISSETLLGLIDFPIEEIKAATNNFSDEYLIAENSIQKVYKLPYWRRSEEEDPYDVLVRRSTTGFPRIELLTEYALSAALEHKNVVSVLGMSEDHEGTEIILVIKNEAKGSLVKHLSDPTLTWIQRLRICLGVARAMSHMHYGLKNQKRAIHGDIKSSKILLDDKWEPKLYGFENSIVCHQNQQLCLTSTYSGTMQYMDPAYEKTKGLNYKTDVFSFGVVLFEVLFGRMASIVNQDKWYFAKLARRHYEEERLDVMIAPVLRQQMGKESLDIFAKTAYCCLNELRAQRLNTNEIVKGLEKALGHQMEYENPEFVTIADDHESTLFIHPKGKSLEHLKIRFNDIKLATENFSKKYFIGSGGFAEVYRAELEYFDSSHPWSVAEKDKGEFPKRRGIVAIKRILTTKGKQGFFGEIELLTNCKHQNIVCLLGFCDEDSHMILVYEYVSNGALDDYLENTSKMTNFTWARRIRICLDIARGLSYLHTNTADQQLIVHRDIKSANILLDNNFKAKIADFGLSKLRPMSQKGSTLKTNHIAGTEVYMDPEYKKTGKLKKESDIYSFGVVLFEIMCGRVAYDDIYLVENENGLPFILRQCFSKGRLNEMVDPNILEAYDNIFMINKGLSRDSLDTFTRIAYKCLAETQDERPSMEVIINELEKALSFEETHEDNLQISVEEINLATKNFSHKNCVGSGRYWKAYKGEVLHANANGRHTSVVAKRWDSKCEHQFLTELNVLFKYKHENIIGLVGYCNGMDEKVIVYEHASNGSLSMYLNDASLTWTKRLKICIDVARGLDCLHGGPQSLEAMMHRGIKSASIQLDGDWKAKISNLHLSSSVNSFNKDIEDVINDANDSLGYLDPDHLGGYFTQEMDIYSLGVVLFEILCGRLAWVEGCEDHSHSLGPLAKCLFKDGKLDAMVFEGIKEQSVPKSLTVFQRVAYTCLNDDEDSRPRASDVKLQLEEALEFQEDYEIWEAKLPKDYKEIFHMSKTPQIYSTESNKGLCHMLNKGILLQEDKVWFSLGSNGERNLMISARSFFYKKRWLRKWRSVPESRFPKVAKVVDISNLMIDLKIRTQLLSLGFTYRVNFIFRFCGPRKSSAKRIYVNFKYKMRGENLHAYFATWRNDGWMMLELGRFLYDKEDTDFEVLLESFSRCYSGSRTIYVEGIEFQAIGNVIYDTVERFKAAIENVMKHEDIEKIEEVQSINNVEHAEIGKLKEVQQVLGSNSKWDKLKFLLSETNRKKYDILSEVHTKKYHMLSAKEFLYDTSVLKLLQLKPSVQSRFQQVVELQSQQVLHIKCKIKLQLLSPSTVYACYLVFKLSERCRGLHCPVIVRDLLHWKRDTGILYFRSPNPWNIHDANQVPEMREDGWMEVNVWKFNSDFELRYGSIPMNLKLVAYEGTMFGLIVYGLEIRPI